VICHRASRPRDLPTYMIHFYADVWRELGHEVTFVFGCRRFVPADLAVLHVDRSLVPAAYLELGRRYPVTLNGEVKDIRKSTVSTQRVRWGDGFEGPVIVKSDLNCAGDPERQRRGIRSWIPRRPRFRSPADYRLFDRATDVPRAIFEDRSCIVERFLPERDGDLYCVRLYHFLGDRSNCSRLASKEPIVCSESHCRVDAVDPHPEIVALRRRLGFDLGKFDYVLRDGRPVLLDANKTPGGLRLMEHTEERLARWRARAMGILAYL
jgi:hypothetical protein